MADLAEIERMIADALPGAEVEVVDETGGGDHLRATVTAVRGQEQDRPAPDGPGGGPGAHGRRLDPRALDPDEAAVRRYRESMPANPELKQQVEDVLKDNRVLLFMKGTPEMPRCGFSMRVVGVLEQMGTEYGAIDVLPILDPLREVTGEIADWRTFPQLYVNGELVGGCDIVEEMAESGELADVLGVEQPDGPGAQAQPEATSNPQQSPPLQVDGT